MTGKLGPLAMVLFTAVACGGTAAPPPKAATGGPPPSAMPPPPPEEHPPPPPPPAELTGTPAAVPPAPASCGAFTAHAVPATPACGKGPAATLKLLAGALANADPVARDAALAGLESCTAIPPGVVRAQRAESAPIECSDALIDPALAAGVAGIAPEVDQALRGLAIAGRLSRLVRDPPSPSAPFNKETVLRFVSDSFGPWFRGQALAVQKQAEEGAKLDGYGKAVAAVEAGLADMRFVELARVVPIPDEIKRDEELRSAYYSALDEAMEPRKIRGRDAALVGLRRFADVGSLQDARVERARVLLSKMWFGGRMTALDALALPALPALPKKRAAGELRTLVGPFYAGLLAKTADASASGLRLALERGFGAPLREALNGEKLTPQAKLLAARGLFQLGQTYWSAHYFSLAEQAAKQALPGLEGAAADEARLVAALAGILAHGPADVVEMMADGPLPAALRNVAALDALATGKGPTAAMAAYDAALLLFMAAPHDAGPAPFDDVEKRLRAAAKMMKDEALRKEAERRADDARDTAQFVREGAAGPPPAGGPRPPPPPPPPR